MTLFEPVSIVLCDYVTYEASGKLIQVGVAGDELRTSETPLFFPTFFLVTTIRPIARRFQFFIDFDVPSGDRLIRMNGSCEFKSEIPQHHTITTNVQLPPVPFPGEGKYVARIRDENLRPVFAKEFFFTVGPVKKPLVTFDATVEIGERFAQDAPI